MSRTRFGLASRGALRYLGPSRSAFNFDPAGIRTSGRKAIARIAHQEENPTLGSGGSRMYFQGRGPGPVEGRNP